MTFFSISANKLLSNVDGALGSLLKNSNLAFDEVTIEVDSIHYLAVCKMLRDTPGCGFEQLIDLCCVDYSGYKNNCEVSFRFCIVLHLLSVRLNHRLRLKVYAPDDTVPIFPSICEIWSSANWFEREAFDLFGIIFEGHTDLRRILTDYGFVGFPFRKDFPMQGHVEMYYDDDQ